MAASHSSTNRPFIIVDEPMVGLDPREESGWSANSLAIWPQNGTTIFMSTHTLKLAEDVCHRIGIINHGTLVATGTIDRI